MRKLTLLPLIACCAPLAAQDAATEAAHAAEAIAACQAVVMQDPVDPERLPASGGTCLTYSVLGCFSHLFIFREWQGGASLQRRASGKG